MFSFENVIIKYIQKNQGKVLSNRFFVSFCVVLYTRKGKASKNLVCLEISF